MQNGLPSIFSTLSTGCSSISSQVKWSCKQPDKIAAHHPSPEILKSILLNYPITVMHLPLVRWFLLLGSPTSGKQFWYSTCVTKWPTFFRDHGSALTISHDWWAAQHLCRRRNSLSDFKHTIIDGNFASLLKAEIVYIQFEGIGGKWTDQQQDKQEQRRTPWVTFYINLKINFEPPSTGKPECVQFVLHCVVKAHWWCWNKNQSRTMIQSQLILMKPRAVNTKLIYHLELKSDTDILFANIKLTFI